MWKFGRTRNYVGTQAAGDFFHSFSGFSQTFMSVSIAWRICSFISFRNTATSKRKTPC